jgi:hypothetical protein
VFAGEDVGHAPSGALLSHEEPEAGNLHIRVCEYCLERIAALKQETDIEKVRALCPDGVDATRFLRSHNSLGSEASYVEETIAFVASLLRMTVSRSFRSRTMAQNGAVTDCSLARRFSCLNDKLT